MLLRTDAQFEIYEILISGIFHLMVLDYSVDLRQLNPQIRRDYVMVIHVHYTFLIIYLGISQFYSENIIKDQKNSNQAYVRKSHL